MKKFFGVSLGAFVIGAALACAQAAPAAPAVFHPGESPAAVQQVQYRSHFRPHRPHYYARRSYGYRHRPHFFHRGPPPRPVPFRRY